MQCRAGRVRPPTGVSFLLCTPGDISILRRHLESGRVTALAGAPEFALPAYVVYPTDSDPAVFDLALDGLRRVSASEER
jgi:hypothetical protein